MNLYSSYNTLFFKHSYAKYLHYDEKGTFKKIDETLNESDTYLYTIIQQMFHYSLPNVHYYYHFIHKAVFWNQEQIRILEMIYMKLQKFKLAFSRFCQMVYKRYKPSFNTKTLLFEPLPKNYISIYENGMIYHFGVLELYKMIESCFNYDSYDIPVILKLKNPYTNIPLKEHNLIYIYFEMI